MTGLNSSDLFLSFFKAETKMLCSVSVVLLVTALTNTWAQSTVGDRSGHKKSKAKPLAANIHDGQGKFFYVLYTDTSFTIDIYSFRSKLKIAILKA